MDAAEPDAGQDRAGQDRAGQDDSDGPAATVLDRLRPAVERCSSLADQLARLLLVGS